MLLKQAAMFYGAGGFRDKFIWDGATFSVPRQASAPRTLRFWCNVNMNYISAENENTVEIQRWDATTNPTLQLFSPSDGDGIVSWTGISSTPSDYTYVVSEVLTGAAQTAPSGYFTVGSHSGSDIGASSTNLPCSPLGSPARWEITIASTHNPSGKTRTGTLVFEFT